MSKHTPGPWEVTVEEYGNSGIIFIDEINRVLHDTEWADPEDWDRDIANAHLISAAPDLYAVAKEIQEAWAYFSEYDVPIGIKDRLDAAIAKAEGAPMSDLQPQPPNPPSRYKGRCDVHGLRTCDECQFGETDAKLLVAAEARIAALEAENSGMKDLRSSVLSAASDGGFYGGEDPESALDCIRAVLDENSKLRWRIQRLCNADSAQPDDLVAGIEALHEQLAATQRLIACLADKPEDRLWHAQDRTWWRRDGGRLVAADPPPEVATAEREAEELRRES